MSETNDTMLSGLSGDQLQNAVQSILRDPAFGKLLSEVQGKREDEPPAVPAITPEMMAKLPQMMTALAPLVGSSAGESHAKKEGGDTKSTANDAERRKKLLMALRPYLSEGRRDALDGIVKVTEMTDLLGGLHLPGSHS